jgi:hypothetical protein
MAGLSKKNIKIMVCVLQLFLVGALFLPAGRIIAAQSRDSSISVFGMIAHYAGMGFSNDALLYTVMACAFPAAIIFCVLFLKERRNFGTATILSALYLSASACFYSAAPQKMVDYADISFLPYLMMLVSLVCLGFLILGFFLAMPPENDKDSPPRPQ